MFAVQKHVEFIRHQLTLASMLNVIPSILQMVSRELKRTSPLARSIFDRVFTATPQKAAASWIPIPDCVRIERTKSPRVSASASFWGSGIGVGFTVLDIVDLLDGGSVN
jgi:hypothetical protein